MKTPWKELFLLFREERKQFLYFSILLLLFFLVRWTIPYWYPSDEAFLKQVRVELIEAEDKSDKKAKFSNVAEASIDINTNDTCDWQQLGFSLRQSEIIINFKNLIGGFESKQELKKVFIINEEKYNLIESFLFIEPDFKKEKTEIAVNRKPEIVYSEKQQPKKTYSPFKFNPNKVTLGNLKAMGFSERQISNLENYRKSGGVYYKKADFARLYSISEKEYEIFEPYIILDSIKKSQKPKKVIRDILDLNTCDSIDLIKMKGIGAYYAHLIIKYRDKLGGYHSSDQLYEIEKIPVETITYCKELLSVDAEFEVKKMDLNSDDFKGFMKHPYFDYYHTKKIFDYKNKKGKFTSLHELNKVGFIEPDFVVKIKPYLKIKK